MCVGERERVTVSVWERERERERENYEDLSLEYLLWWLLCYISLSFIFNLTFLFNGISGSHSQWGKIKAELVTENNNTPLQDKLERMTTLVSTVHNNFYFVNLFTEWSSIRIIFKN